MVPADTAFLTQFDSTRHKPHSGFVCSHKQRRHDAREMVAVRAILLLRCSRSVPSRPRAPSRSSPSPLSRQPSGRYSVPRPWPSNLASVCSPQVPRACPVAPLRHRPQPLCFESRTRQLRSRYGRDLNASAIGRAQSCVYPVGWAGKGTRLVDNIARSGSCPGASDFFCLCFSSLARVCRSLAHLGLFPRA